MNGPAGVGKENLFDNCIYINQFFPGLVVAAGHGVMRTMYNIPEYIADIIPVDTVINLTCAVAYKTAKQYDKSTGMRPKEIPVYNCNSSTEKPVTWQECGEFWTQGYHKFPFENMLL